MGQRLTPWTAHIRSSCWWIQRPARCIRAPQALARSRAPFSSVSVRSAGKVRANRGKITGICVQQDTLKRLGKEKGGGLARQRLGFINDAETSSPSFPSTNSPGESGLMASPPQNTGVISTHVHGAQETQQADHGLARTHQKAMEAIQRRDQQIAELTGHFQGTG